MNVKRRLLQLLTQTALAATLAGLGSAAYAAAGPMDFLFTTGHLPAADTTQGKARGWKFSEFGALKLVAREPGSAANQHPALLSSEALVSELARIELVLPGQKTERLFSDNELGELAPYLVKALAAAGPDDDVLLLSTARRGSGFISALLSLTARVFVQDGALQLIVKEARTDAYSPFKIHGVIPKFEFGTRAAASEITLRHPTAKAQRADWLAMSLQPVAAATAVATPAVARPLAAPAPAPAVQAAPAEAAPVVRNQAFYEQQEQRLKGLKRLHEQGLLKDEEYEQKRQEILRSL